MTFQSLKAISLAENGNGGKSSSSCTIAKFVALSKFKICHFMSLTARSSHFYLKFWNLGKQIFPWSSGKGAKTHIQAVVVSNPGPAVETIYRAPLIWIKSMKAKIVEKVT